MTNADIATQDLIAAIRTAVTAPKGCAFNSVSRYMAEADYLLANTDLNTDVARRRAESIRRAVETNGALYA